MRNSSALSKARLSPLSVPAVAGWPGSEVVLWHLLLPCVATSAICTAGTLAVEPTPGVERVLSEGIPAWARLRHDGGNVHGVMLLSRSSYKVGDSSSDSAPKTVRIRFARCGENRLAVIDADDRGKQRAFARNSKYALQLACSDSTSPWVVEYYGDDKQRRIEHEIDALALSYIDCAWTLHGMALQDWTSSPALRLLGLSSVEEAVPGAVRLDFEYSPPADAVKSTPMRHGWILCDTAHGWAIRSYEVFTVFGTVKGSVEYAFDRGGVVPRRLHFELYNIQKQAGSVTSCEFDQFAFGDTPAEAFTLEAFGLGGLTDKTATSHRRRALWLSAAGFALLVGAVALRRKCRQSRVDGSFTSAR